MDFGPYHLDRKHLLKASLKTVLTEGIVAVSKTNFSGYCDNQCCKSVTMYLKNWL